MEYEHEKAVVAAWVLIEQTGLFMLVGLGLPPLCITRVYYENDDHVEIEQRSRNLP